MSSVYESEMNRRFGPLVDVVVDRAALQAGESVIDVGTGSGAAAVRAAAAVGTSGRVLGVDISRDMLALAARRSAASATPFEVALGSAEALPVGDGTVDVVLASLSLMFAPDKAAAAREMARVLRPDGRFVASVWGPQEECDIVRFQKLLGRFAPEPPVRGLGPGSMGDPSAFLADLDGAGIFNTVETEELAFEFDTLDAAWNVLGPVTARAMSADRLAEARAAVVAEFWPDPGRPRQFRNRAWIIVGRRR